MFLSVLRHSWATGMVTETVLKIIGEENVSGQPTFTEKMAVKNVHIQTDNKLSVI